VLSVSHAEKIILDLVQSGWDAEVVTLLTAIERILAAPVVKPVGFSHWDNSAMDGYGTKT